MRITLRPHHVLCRLGFRGYGYSPEFVEEMRRLVKIISSGRAKTIVVRPGWDNICRNCPHCEYECSEKTPGLRGRTATEIDHRALKALRLKYGHPYPIPEIDERFANLTPVEFAGVCLGCEWQPMGFCAEAHLALRRRYRLPV